MASPRAGQPVRVHPLSLLLIAVSVLAIYTASWYVRRVPQVHEGVRTFLAPQLTEEEAEAQVGGWSGPVTADSPQQLLCHVSSPPRFIGHALSILCQLPVWMLF